ncbi:MULTISPECIES: hypothetical protein [Pandoraea]|uniref:Uncharacterized protein n=1 Tax=Pandoraea pneumonica TaxID=2508299 RepID=A0A5E4RKF0_9BURK|nr:MULTISPECIES: hypothetical protein [Pandoraea]AJF00195.1 hypothetical protein SG18_22100 [Pandoraea apista]AKH74356.1 hypothetical protein XM39_22280 [Pandoraea apista]AKI62906.1 hypothetical protein AA956_15605 [Pandoraea apista]VVD62489.1 hypothetical protein PPN31114_00173 [Pandoraea pneumonica]
MEVQVSDVNARIGRMMGANPKSRWVIKDNNDEILAGDVADEPTALAMIPTICEKTGRPAGELRAIREARWPDYLGVCSIEQEQTEFTHWAMRELGHVSVFGFNERPSDEAFLVIDQNGKRATGRTLAECLYRLVEYRRARSTVMA